MFGFSDNNLEKSVLKGNWDKIRKNYLNGNESVQLELAKACAKSTSDDSVNVLVSLLDIGSDAVKIEALKSIGQIGTDHVVAPLQQILAKATPEQTELKTQLQETLAILRGRK